MNRLFTLMVTGVLGAGLLAGCESMGMGRRDDGQASKSAQKQMAVAQIGPSQIPTTRPTLGSPTGTVTFTQSGDEVKIVANIQGLKPNATHAIHIHEKGDLSAPDFSSAGGHYNPQGHPHAGPDAEKRHAGDLGNLKSDAQGRARLELTVDNITLNGQTNPIVGKPVIIHAQADDLKSQPSGAAGDRIGGGIIKMKD